MAVGKTVPGLRRMLSSSGATPVAVRVRALRALAVLERPADAARVLATYALCDPSPWVADVCLLLLDDLKRRDPEIKIPPWWQRVLASIRRVHLIKPFLILVAALATFIGIGWLVSRFDPRVFSFPWAMFLFNVYYVVALYPTLTLAYERQTWRAWRGLGVAGLKTGMYLASIVAFAINGVIFLGPVPYLVATASIAASLWIARRFVLVQNFKGGVVSKTLLQFLAPSLFALIYVATGMMPFQEIPIQPNFLPPCTLIAAVSFCLFLVLNRFGISRIGAAQAEQSLLVIAQQTVRSRIGLFDAVGKDIRCWAIRALGRLQYSPKIDDALYRILWSDALGYVQTEAIRAREAIRLKAGKDPQEGLELVTIRERDQAPFFKNVQGRVGIVLTLAALIFTSQLYWKLYQSHSSLDAAKAFLLYRIGDEKAAVASYEKHLQNHERNAETLNFIAWIYATARDPAARNPTRAIEYAQTAVELDGWKTGPYIDTLAEAYLAAGRPREAQDTFERALKSSSVTHRLYLRYRIAQIRQFER